MKGFTLVELLVVTAIIAILSLVVLVNYPAAREQLALQRAATKLAQDIRRVQEMAIASAECPVGTGCAGQIPETGYGVYINVEAGFTITYKLYANTGGGEEAYSGADTIIEDIWLEKGIYIFDIPESAPNKVSINFKPPDPEIAIKWDVGSSPNDFVSIVLCGIGADCNDPANIRTVYVNKAGLISVN